MAKGDINPLGLSFIIRTDAGNYQITVPPTATKLKSGDVAWDLVPLLDTLCEISGYWPKAKVRNDQEEGP